MSTSLDALQACLAAEHAAVYVLAVAGGQVSASQSPTVAARIRAAYDVHRARRDHLRAAVAAAGGVPVAPAPAYAVDTADLLRVAAETEAAAAEAYAQLVAQSAGATRGWAVEALVDAAVRALDLGGAPTPWPGLPEL